jgi:hypothetical protein
VDGVSDMAAGAVWALDAMFNAAYPQPPDQPGANATCAVGGIGANFHNAEREPFFHPEEGNAHYNAIRFDPTPAARPPASARITAAFAWRSAVARPWRSSGPPHAHARP